MSTAECDTTPFGRVSCALAAAGSDSNKYGTKNQAPTRAGARRFTVHDARNARAITKVVGEEGFVTCVCLIAIAGILGVQ
jgi:hypothetical protein